MVIHNKDGSDAPLSKRLISLQSVFTLLYTGLRFLQLQQWQQEVMPPQLKGGVKGRQMAEVHMTMQLEIDRAHGNFAALKLDKAQCFDRLMPKLCAAIMLALGLPQGFVCGFLALCARMTRFLSFKQWTRAQAISTPNGVAQGCSLSLLCINVHMAIWVWIISNIDGIDFRAIIDDTYIWSRLPSITNLVAAVRATELWDSLCGQFLNASKCEAFATTGDLRKELKLAFPQMKVVEVVNIRGAYVQTTKKNVGNFPVSKLQAALRDCESIRDNTHHTHRDHPPSTPRQHVQRPHTETTHRDTTGWVFSVPRLVLSLPVVFPFPRLVFSVPVVFLVPRSWCFQFLDWCFPCPAPVLVFLVPRFGCFQSWTMCSLPGSCVGVPFHVFVCQLSFEFLATIAHRWI